MGQFSPLRGAFTIGASGSRGIGRDDASVEFSHIRYVADYIPRCVDNSILSRAMT